LSENNPNIQESSDSTEIEQFPRATQEFSFTSSPIPPAEELQKLAHIIPNAGERFMTLFEGNVQHNQQIDREMIGLNKQAQRNELVSIKLRNSNVRWGQWIVAIIALSVVSAILAIFVMTYWLYMAGFQFPATAFFAIATLASIAGGNRIFRFFLRERR